MFNIEMTKLGENRSAIRELFEYGKKRKREIGAENVFDFSLGNPSIPAPEAVKKAYINALENISPTLLHGYTSANGDQRVREKISDYIKNEFKAESSASLIYMTCGAAASLTITLNAIVNEGDEVIVIAPFFPEYKVFVEAAGAKLRVVKSRETDFQIDFSELEKAISDKTKAIIVNSPNNPTGVVLGEETLGELASLLEGKSKKYGSEIFIISDEPYRELAYDVCVPYIPNYYDNTVVCYSYSKSLSLPGERIGYIFVSPKCSMAEKLYASVCGAGRSLGYVCAPSLSQYVIGECLSETADVSAYDKNRKLLYNSLTEMGYSAVYPEGAFYLFVKSPNGSSTDFCNAAKENEILIVPSDSFGYTGYARISYCVDYSVIERSLPAFKRVIKEMKVDKK